MAGTSCCCYCMLGGSSKGGYATSTDLREAEIAIRREMAHMKVDDLAQAELIEELQQRITTLQKCVYDLIQYIGVSTCGHCGFTALTPNGTKPSIPEVPRLLDQDLYRRYLLGDHEQEGKDNKGYQLDDDLRSRTGVVPARMLNDTENHNFNHLESPTEDDRPEDKIKVQNMFIGVGNEGGSNEADLLEYKSMLEDDDSKSSAEEALRLMYYEGVQGYSASSSDMMELDEEGE